MSEVRGARRRSISVEFDLRTLVSIAIGLTILLLFLALSSAISNVLLLIGIGSILALALDPLVNALQTKLAIRRLFAVLIVGGAFVAVATFVIAVMGPPAITQAQKFGEELPNTVEQMYSFPSSGRGSRTPMPP